MRFTVEIDLDHVTEDRAEEVGRILRYWGGHVTDELLTPGTEHGLTDSTHATVGTLSVTD